MDTLSKDSKVHEASYYASRVIEVFRNLKERLSYQGGGSLPEHCQKEFLKHALSAVLDSLYLVIMVSLSSNSFLLYAEYLKIYAHDLPSKLILYHFVQLIQ
jgi:hypothetical protein